MEKKTFPIQFPTVTVKKAHRFVVECLPQLSGPLPNLPETGPGVFSFYHRAVLLQPQHVGREGLLRSIGVLFCLLLTSSVLVELQVYTYINLSSKERLWIV